MPKYLLTASYSQDGLRGVLSEGGTSRRTAVEKAVAAVGGRVEAFYYALGEDDAYVIVDLPDNTTAVSLSLAVNATGAVQMSTTALLTTEEMDAAVKQSASVAFRPPGG